MKNLSLSQRISVYLFFVVCVSTFVMNSTFFIVLQNQSEDQFNLQTTEILSNINRYYQIPVWNLDYHGIITVTDTWLQTRSGVLAIRVTDEASNLIVQKTKENKLFDLLLKQPHTILKKEKITHDNRQHIGFVEVIFSNADIVEQNNFTYIKSILGSLIFAFILSLVSNHFLSLFLHRPLQNLISGTQAARNSNYTIRVPEDAVGEIGMLASEFNKTMNAIQDRDQRLLEHNNQLEEIIRLRTIELDKQRANMINSARLAALGEFSAGMSHEINNPLAVIIGKATILRTFVGKGLIAPEYEIHFIKITEMCDRISKIIKNLRAYARDGSNDPFDSFELNRFLSDIGELTRLKLDKKAINFRMQNHSSLLKIYGKEIPLSQVIINLINNSADAVENAMDKWVELTISDKDGHIVFSVKDSGQGIPEDVQKKMMTPFFTTKIIGKGTGLGLSISKGIIEEHKGELIYSIESGNTEFIVRLPIVTKA
ncbi:MAG: GHKL domain-containing protein [Bdellovibrionaceae bacterium]|nr:GHKL domain-containing protein [Pseudobdellovibrionaceae bacterium]